METKLKLTLLDSRFYYKVSTTKRIGVDIEEREIDQWIRTSSFETDASMCSQLIFYKVVKDIYLDYIFIFGVSTLIKTFPHVGDSLSNKRNMVLP